MVTATSAHTHTHMLSGCDFSLRITQQLWPAGKQEVGRAAAVVHLSDPEGSRRRSDGGEEAFNEAEVEL